MTDENHATEIWNRAADAIADGVPAGAGEGDRRLVAALSLDGEAQGNGLAQAMELGDVAAAVDAFRWFGLEDVAGLLEEAGPALTDDPDGERDEELSGRYYALDTEARLTEGLEQRLRTDPEAFLSL